MSKGSTGGGQFTKGGSGSGTQQQKPGAHQAHVAHVAHVAHEKAVLTGQARADRAKASALMKRRALLQRELASASGQVSKGQAGSRTASNATTRSSAPQAPATQAQAQAAPAARPGATNPSGTSASLQYQGGTASLNTTASQNALKTQIAALNTQINQLLAAAAQADAKAKALK